METIKHHDHSNTPGAIKRRKAAQRRCRWSVACVTVLVCIISVANAVTWSIPVEAAARTLTKPEPKQVETIHTAANKLLELPVEEPDQAAEAPVVVDTEPEWFQIEATAYCSCAKCCGEWAGNRPNGVVYTADGSVAQQGVTIAADWDVFPAGTVLYIEGLGERIVQDRGGAINGMDVDVYFDDHQEALEFGRRHLNAYVVSYGE